MLEMTSVVRSWDNFTSLGNATDKLVALSEGDEVKLKNYLLTLNCIYPLSWEDGVTRIDDIWEPVLALTSKGIKKINFTGIITYKEAKAGQCHKVAAKAYLKNPNLKWMIGFAAIDEASAALDWHLHSFLIEEQDDDLVIIEPTTFDRDYYFGIEVNEEVVDLLIKQFLSS